MGAFQKGIPSPSCSHKCNVLLSYCKAEHLVPSRSMAKEHPTVWAVLEPSSQYLMDICIVYGFCCQRHCVPLCTCHMPPGCFSWKWNHEAVEPWADHLDPSQGIRESFRNRIMMSCLPRLHIPPPHRRAQHRLLGVACRVQPLMPRPVPFCSNWSATSPHPRAPVVPSTRLCPWPFTCLTPAHLLASP